MIPSVEETVSTQPGDAVEKPERLFKDIDGDQEATVIESLCMNCEEQGITRLLLTVIPHFREVIIMHFECEHCGFSNNEIQSGSMIAEKALKIKCVIENKEDLNRQVVKSESASVKFEELDFEIPAETQRGVLSTVEGIISKSIEGLSALQPQRKLIDENIYNKIEEVLDTLRGYLELRNVPFTVSIDDPAGNSYIENLSAPKKDPKLLYLVYPRTREQDEFLGMGAPAQEQEEEVDEDLAKEVHIFHGNCSRCNAPSDTRMHLIDIPHFKEVVIMATDCETCGYKSNEVKAGGPISAQGKKIILKVTEKDDLSRDILKSETCGLQIPELDLELNPGTLGGRFTTVEGLLTQVHEELTSRATPFSSGDSADETRKAAFARFLDRLQTVPYTLILDDPLGNSYLQNPNAPDDDPEMTIELYDRTFEQNEDLGLNDMVLEGYEQPEEGEEKDEKEEVKEDVPASEQA
ncbi:ZPR1 zinc-finger domain-containing protein [Chytridium lagenaria]|nr:ZPR1 zinc-finger domain-containing protein [Chytridium lagenaria]